MRGGWERSVVIPKTQRQSHRCSCDKTAFEHGTWLEDSPHGGGRQDGMKCGEIDGGGG